MRLALFDLDNTLVDHQTVMLGFAGRFAERHGLDLDETLAALIATDEYLWSERLAALRQRFDLPESTEALLAEHQRDFLECFRPAAATVDALGALRAAGWRIGIVTNGGPFQEDKLVAAGLDRLVDGYVVSDLVGWRKPSPAIFAAAARLCGCGEGEGWAAALEVGWMVGDSAPADIGGARASGLRSVWLHCGRRWEDAVVVPDAWAVRIGEAAPDLTGLRPDHIVDDPASAVALMLS
jgi:putative hydrolase of the HAD superfamily